MSKLSCYEFGRQLIETNDLDPVYVLLHHSDFNTDRLLHWLLSYFAFYHVGTASWCTEPCGYRDLPEDTQDTLSFDTYWKRMYVAAGSKYYPRCHERRHFRGKFALDTVTKLAEKSVEERFLPLLGHTLTVGQVFDEVKPWYGFGIWISFKIADIMERLGLAQVEFSEGSVFMFKSPREGAQLLWQQEKGTEPDGTENEWAVSRILEELGSLKAPPRYERCINIQECETVLCKYKGYMGGHYKLGEDIASCRKGLLRYSRTRTAQQLLQAGTRGGLW